MHDCDRARQALIEELEIRARIRQMEIKRLKKELEMAVKIDIL